MTYSQAVGKLHDAGRHDLATGAWEHYKRFCESVGPFQEGYVLQMFDDVLEQHLKTDDPVGQEEVLLSPDFAPIKALARAVQALDMPVVLAEADYEVVVQD